MCPDQPENQSDPELLVTTAFVPGGWTVEVRRAGKVAFSDQGYNSEEAAWSVGKRYVKALLRAQLAAAGVARRGERPAFTGGPGFLMAETTRCNGCGVLVTFRTLDPWGRCRDCAAHVPEPAGDQDPAEAQQLEGEQLCTCDHPDGLHLLGTNSCAREGCRCAEFTPVAKVEAVDAEVH